MENIICCHCGAMEGFYVKETVKGVSTPHYTKNGHYANENSHIYNYLTHSGGEKAYCLVCDKYIGKSQDLISGLTEEDAML
ncbi:hypothetical protein BH753_gp009 [Bacillus phage Shbh1]|uniref:Uncharacterized protein n=1 Tax=Bacillus phage Shbh1 TaxID=1796992 RepID=A0A142F134_9CAUD|nr:hypothetical protein BH753_gp009 [Bacillus phage Shbh1]AMQ66491.1 hypothetical protein [Bacillus phage Shbh1]